MLATHAWEFGWEALVALGTLGLAGATAFLAWQTKSVAAGTTADLEAQWRPAILPGNPQALKHRPQDNRLNVPIRNAGRGPAMFVRTLLDPANASPDNWSLGALAHGDEVILRFSGVYNLASHCQVLLDYRDLAGRYYSSALVLDLQQDPPRFYDVHLFRDEHLTPHGDALPQSGLTPLPSSTTS